MMALYNITYLLFSSILYKIYLPWLINHILSDNYIIPSLLISPLGLYVKDIPKFTSGVQKSDFVGLYSNILHWLANHSSIIVLQRFINNLTD